MASGFNTAKYSSTTVAVGSSGYGYYCCEGYVTQSVNSSTRKVTITVTASLTYHRNSSGGAWNPGTNAIAYNWTSGNYVRATLDGSNSDSGYQLGLKGKNTSLPANTYSNLRIGRVANYNVSQASKSTTYSYNDNGDAITKSWSASIKYGSTTMSVSGSVTTDSIAPAYSDPTGLDVSLDSFTDTSATLSSSVSSYGNPASATGRYIEGDVLGTSTFGAPYRFATATNVSSSTFVVDNNSQTASANPLTIVGNTQYWYGAYADNTQKYVSIVKGDFVTLPAYITSVGSVDNGHGSITFTVNHNTEGSAYTVQNQYSLNQTTWTNMSNSVTLSLADTTTVYFRRTSTAGTTPVVSKTVTPFFNRFVYVGVGGVSKKSKKIYVGVNGQSKLVKKIYVGVNGRSKLVYKSS